MKQSGPLEHFKVRGDGGSRLEALSDGVFALAIAILLLSSSVPHNYDELWLFVKDLFPFGVCILFIYWIWRQQSTFFQRYGLIDDKTSILNLALLFFVLFYVYPLKFLMTWLLKYFLAIFTGTLGSEFENLNQMIPMNKMPHLMVIYGLGFVCIWLVLYLMYRHALKHREALDLNKIEIYETEYSLKEKRSLLLIGILSVSLAGLSTIFNYPLGAALAGWVYNLIWVIAIFDVKKRTKKLAQLTAKNNQ